MGSFVCDDCGRRFFPLQSDYVSDGVCPDCDGVYITDQLTPDG